MLLLLSNTYTRTKFSRVTMNSQNQEPPLNASTTVPHCCQQLFLSISSYTKKNSSKKVCNRYILSFQTKVHLWQQSFLFHIFLLLFLLCSHFVLEKLVILIGSRAPIVSCATHFTILSKKLVCWAILWSFSWANISLFWRENGVGTHFEQQFFSFTQH